MQSNAGASIQVSGTPGVAAKLDEFQLARDALWKKAYVQFQKDEPELVAAYEKLITDQNALGGQPLLTSEAVSTVVMNQKTGMESRQRTYPWFGRKKPVRDTVDSILRVVQQSAGLISAGMTMAPIYVSLPWSFIAILIPFITRDSKELEAALNGLKEVTRVMASYSYAEQAFLTDAATKVDFEESVTTVYTSILEYQAAAAVYFAKGTLKRLGHSFAAPTSWSDALIKVRDQDRTAQNTLRGLDANANRTRFEATAALLGKGLDLMSSIASSIASSPDRIEREKILDWISSENVAEDHFNVEEMVGENYLDSGAWLIKDAKDFSTWLQSKDGTLLLQGIVGSGKSSLICMVINHLVASSDNRTAFAYFSSSTAKSNQDQPTRNRTRDVIRRILKQCAYDSKGKLAESIEHAYFRSDNPSSGGWNINLNAATMQLQLVLQEHAHENFIFVFDALDECPNLAELLDSLSMVKKASPNLKLFMSGRFKVKLPKAFNVMEVAIGLSNTTDIVDFVENEVDRRYEGSNWTAEQAERLKKALKLYAEGMFRWVELQIDLFFPSSPYLAEPQMPVDIEARLSKFENAKFESLSKLSGAYQAIWRRALGKEDEVARRSVIKAALKWVLCAFRLLQAFELAEAASTQEKGVRLTVPEDMLLGYCNNLIVKDNNGAVRLSHISVKQFLEDEKADDFRPEYQHRHALITCMVTRSSRPNFKLWLDERPDFEGYCMFNWPLHYERCSVSASRLDLLKKNQLNSRLGALIRHVSGLQYGGSPSRRQEGEFNMARTIVSQTVRETFAQSRFRRLSEYYERTEASLILTMEELLSEISLDTPGRVGQGFLRRLIRLIDSHVTILNPYGIPAKRLAFVLGAETFLRNLIIDAEMILGYEDEGMREYAYTGFFDRMARLSTFLSSNTNSGVMRAHPHVDQHTAETASRPTVVFERRDQPCNVCNLSKWIEGSRHGDSFTICASRQEWHKARQAGCELCTWAMRVLYAHVGISEATNKVAVKVRVMLDKDSNVVSGSDVIRYFIPNIGYADLEFCLIDDNAASLSKTELLRGRAFSPDDLDLARNWLKDCTKDHQCMSTNQSNKNSVPTRLIDVGDPEGELSPKLCDLSSGVREQTFTFVFLSVKWGRFGKRLSLELQQTTMTEWMTSIPTDNMETLHRDAMIVCHELGYRYLWIDALCVIQDDPNDKDHELSNIGTYLTSADLVLAASSRSMTDQLMPTKDETILTTLQANTVNTPHRQLTIGIRKPLQSVDNILNQSILNDQWRIQEIILPRRLLIFGKEQLHWLCQESLASQSTTMRRQTPLTTFPAIAKRFKDLQESHSNNVATDLIHDYVHYVAEISSRGKLYWDPDALLAMEHIASSITRLTGETYCAGLWLEDLLHGLLWIKMKPSVSRRNKNSRGRLRTAPTWSWAHDKAPISYALVAGLNAFEKTAKEWARPVDSVGHRVKDYVLSNLSLFEFLHVMLAALLPVMVPLVAVFGHVLPRLEKFLLTPKEDLLLRLVDHKLYNSEWTDTHHRTASLRTSACTTRAMLVESSSLDQYQYFFDYELGLGQDVEIADLYFIAVSPWKYTPEGDARWAGLMLEKVEADSETYERRGVFIGPRVEEQLQGWERKTITLR